MMFKILSGQNQSLMCVCDVVIDLNQLQFLEMRRNAEVFQTW